MLLKILYAIIVWIVVTIVLSLFGGLLVTVDQEVTVKIGQFLKDHSMIIGFLAGLCYYVWGSWTPEIRR